MSTLKSSAEDLTLNADGSGNDIKFQSNAVEKASISDAGLLTTSGGASLDGAVTINESGADVDFRVESDDNTNMLFVDGGNDAVGIGTGSPSAALETKNTTDGTTLAFQATNDNDHEIVRIGAETNGDGYLTIHGQGASTNTKILLHTDDTSYINGGDLSLGGDLYFTTAGKGICLGVTSNTDSNTLDDYEEGTWTPQIYGSVTGTGTTVDGQGEYVKIGRMVNVTGEVNPFTDAEIDGGLMFQNLPFARSTVGTPDWTTFQPMVLYGMDTMGSGFQYLYFHGSTGGTFKETKDGIASVTLDTDDISSSLNLSAVKFSFSYPT